jgi:maleylpyruvate isomerase
MTLGENLSQAVPPLSPETVLLRQRQGAGARYDTASAPAVELGWARLGTAYFARKLNEIKDDELDEPTLIPGWSRRRLIAHVGYQARALTRIVEAARTGQPVQEVPEEQQGVEANAATLPARALRNLFHHSEVHLNVEWRDLTGIDWQDSVVLPGGTAIPIAQTPAIRARVVWVHAVDLNNLGSFRDFPPSFLEWLAAEELLLQEPGLGKSSLALGPSGVEYVVRSAAQVAPVKGTLADIVRWLCGRGARRLTPPDPEILHHKTSGPGPLGLSEMG